MIFASNDLPMELVNVPEWGGHVYVRTWMGHERDAFDISIEGNTKEERLHSFRARVAVMATCDEAGNLLFSLSDIEALTLKSGVALDRIFEVGKRLNGLGADEQKELVENFADTPSDDSGSN